MFNKAPKSVAEILATFTKTLDQLKLAETQNVDAMNSKTEDAERLRVEADSHRKEASYASEIAANITAMITPKEAA